MIFEMYAIKDELNGFMPPLPIASKEIAERYFKDQMLGNPTMTNSPKDFSIWKIGTYDTEAGNFISIPNGNELIQRGENYANENNTI